MPLAHCQRSDRAARLSNCSATFKQKHRACSLCAKMFSVCLICLLALFGSAAAQGPIVITSYSDPNCQTPASTNLGIASPLVIPQGFNSGICRQYSGPPNIAIYMSATSCNAAALGDTFSFILFSDAQCTKQINPQTGPGSDLKMFVRQCLPQSGGSYKTTCSSALSAALSAAATAAALLLLL